MFVRNGYQTDEGGGGNPSASNGYTYHTECKKANVDVTQSPTMVNEQPIEKRKREWACESFDVTHNKENHVPYTASLLGESAIP